MRKLITAIGLSMAAAVTGVNASAAEGFFKDKTLTYIVATSPGGGYDTYARLIAKYMGKHLQADKILVKNIPGAGHIVGANTLYASKPDGLTIGMFNTGLIYSQILNRKGVQFDLSKMTWIGKAAADPRAIVISAGSGIEDYAGLSAAKGIKFATSGVGSASYTDTNLIASALNLDLDIITGFNGNEAELAMIRGEIGGHVASLSSLQGFVDNGNGKFVATIGGKISGVPEAKDIAGSAKGKSIISLIEAISVLGRLTAAPPGVPADRTAELRAAYDKSMSDPELLAEAAKLGRPIEPASGAEVEGLIIAALDQTPETIAIIAKAVDVKVPLTEVKANLDWLSDDKKLVKFKHDDDEITAKISGSRTEITIAGEKASRKKLAVGMSCEISYDSEHEENEPKKMICN